MSEEKNIKTNNQSKPPMEKPAVESANVKNDSNKSTAKKKSFGDNKKRRFSRDNREDDGFEQKIVDLARVTRVMKGGKRMRFRACIAVGNKAGKVGVGIAKAADVTNAITKAAEKAKKNIINVQIIDGTIAHNISHKYGAARIMLKPAMVGKGIIAGGAMRIVLELAGIHNIVGKNQGSKNKVNIVNCVIEGLTSLKQMDIKKPDEKKKSDPKKESVNKK
ncbi:MAG: 30S ribosomal protein S5 [bacterium]|nr:30S ribosomal protein S5 [bacterium]